MKRKRSTETSLNIKKNQIPRKAGRPPKVKKKRDPPPYNNMLCGYSGCDCILSEVCKGLSVKGFEEWILNIIGIKSSQFVCEKHYSKIKNLKEWINRRKNGNGIIQHESTIGELYNILNRKDWKIIEKLCSTRIIWSKRMWTELFDGNNKLSKCKIILYYYQSDDSYFQSMTWKKDNKEYDFLKGTSTQEEYCQKYNIQHVIKLNQNLIHLFGINIFGYADFMDFRVQVPKDQNPVIKNICEIFVFLTTIIGEKIGLGGFMINEMKSRFGKIKLYSATTSIDFYLKYGFKYVLKSGCMSEKEYKDYFYWVDFLLNPHVNQNSAKYKKIYKDYLEKTKEYIPIIKNKFALHEYYGILHCNPEYALEWNQ